MGTMGKPQKGRLFLYDVLQVESSWPSYVKQIIFWIICGFGFSAFVFANAGGPAAASWSYGYFLEYMLSVAKLGNFKVFFFLRRDDCCVVGRCLCSFTFQGLLFTLSKDANFS